MLKLIFCLRRLPGLSRDEFQRYWRETHAPLVRRHADALGIDRYVQVHAGHDDLGAALRAIRGAPEPYDGVAELWWKDRASFEAALALPAAQRAGAEFGDGLIDDVRISRVAISHGALTVRITEEPRVVQPEPFSRGETEIEPTRATSLDVTMAVFPSATL